MPRDHDPGLDSVDRQILAELQQDGRMTNVELARRVNLSAPPCLRRVRRLEETGIYVNLLPENDALRIKQGLSVYSETELRTVLEDLGE